MSQGECRVLLCRAITTITPITAMNHSPCRDVAASPYWLTRSTNTPVAATLQNKFGKLIAVKPDISVGLRPSVIDFRQRQGQDQGDNAAFGSTTYTGIEMYVQDQRLLFNLNQRGCSFFPSSPPSSPRPSPPCPPLARLLLARILPASCQPRPIPCAALSVAPLRARPAGTTFPVRTMPIWIPLTLAAALTSVLSKPWYPFLICKFESAQGVYTDVEMQLTIGMYYALNLARELAWRARTADPKT